jgi:flagellin
MTELQSEIDAIASKAAFNGTKLLDGSFTGKQLQVGANKGENMEISIAKMNTTGLGLNTSANIAVDTHANASATMSRVTTAIKSVSAARSSLGAKQNRLDYTINNLKNYSENLTSAESQIRDTDMATEMTNYSKNNILQQAAQSMLAQANQSTQGSYRQRYGELCKG